MVHRITGTLKRVLSQSQKCTPRPSATSPSTSRVRTLCSERPTRTPLRRNVGPRGVLPPAVYAELAATGQFDTMPLDVDEAEHSLEMHLPYIRTVFGQADLRIVPILVGALSPDAERRFGARTAPLGGGGVPAQRLPGV